MLHPAFMGTMRQHNIIYRFVFFVVLALAIPVEKSYAQKPLPCAYVDLVLVFDVSGSMSSLEQKRFMRGAIEVFATKYVLNESNLKIGLITFASEAYAIQTLTANAANIYQSIAMFEDPSGGTDLEKGIVAAEEMFEEHGRKNAMKLAIFFTDGMTSDFDRAIWRAQQLKEGAWSDDLYGYAQPILIHAVNVYGTHLNTQLFQLLSNPTFNQQWRKIRLDELMKEEEPYRKKILNNPNLLSDYIYAPLYTQHTNRSLLKSLVANEGILLEYQLGELLLQLESLNICG